MKKKKTVSGLVDFSLGLPNPESCTNADLNSLRPIYQELLSNQDYICEYIDEALDLSVSADSAILMLCIFEYPLRVRLARIQGEGDDESFPLSDVLEKIAKNQRLCTWCRSRIASPSSVNGVVLASCMNLLSSIPEVLPEGCVAKYTKRYILDVDHTESCMNLSLLVPGLFNKKNILDNNDFDKELIRLYKDLGSVVAKDSLPPMAVVTAIHLFTSVCAMVKGESEKGNFAFEVYCQTNFTNTAHRFKSAVERMRRYTDEETYSHYVLRVNLALTSFDNLPFNLPPAMSSVTSTTVATTLTKEKTAAAQCHAKGCNKPWTKICSKCKVAKYCSRECQVRDWKTHKECCGREKEDWNKIQTQGIRVATHTQHYTKSPALKLMDSMLADHPEVDYVFTGENDENVALRFFPFDESVRFRLIRSKALTNHFWVWKMYDMIHNSVLKKLAPVNHRGLVVKCNMDPHTPIKAFDAYFMDMIRRQLIDEYGVDPISRETLALPPLHISEEEIAQGRKVLLSRVSST